MQTIEVRIPFSLNDEGVWHAVAWKDSQPEDGHIWSDEAIESDIVYRCWIVATVEVPDMPVPDVQATVEEAPDAD